MTEKCTICGRVLGKAYRCPACSFDRRGDFVGLRTVSPVGKRDLYDHLVCREWEKLAQDGEKNRGLLAIHVEYISDEQLTKPGVQTEHGTSDVFNVERGVLKKYNGKSKSVDIPPGVTAIGPYAFENNSQITLVNIPLGVSVIGVGAFHGCTQLETVTFPEGIKDIKDYAFCGCESLSQIVIPGSVKTIGSCVFKGCAALTRAEIPEGVKNIEGYAFNNCKKLRTLILPGSIEKIGLGAFFGCVALAEIIVPREAKSRIQRLLDSAAKRCVREK